LESPKEGHRTAVTRPPDRPPPSEKDQALLRASLAPRNKKDGGAPRSLGGNWAEIAEPFPFQYSRWLLNDQPTEGLVTFSYGRRSLLADRERNRIGGCHQPRRNRWMTLSAIV
jgi:hypothetical protein